jgi:hypothetical protein
MLSFASDQVADMLELPIKGLLTSAILVKRKQRCLRRVLSVSLHRRIALNLSISVLVTEVTNVGTGDA